MAEKEYNSKIDKVTVHTTAKGTTYVDPFDVIRSEKGRAVVKSHASTKTRAAVAGASNAGNRSKNSIKNNVT